MAEAPPPQPLTEQQLRFCEEYAARPNACQAYRRAFGPVAYNTARTEGPRLLANPAIAAEVEAAREHYRTAVRVDAERVLREVAAVAFADPADLYEPDPSNQGLPTPRPWGDVPPAARKAVASVRVKRKKLKAVGEAAWEIEELEYRTHSKLDALDKLCRHLGLLKDGAALEALVAALRGGTPAAGPPADAATAPGADPAVRRVK